MKMKLMRIVLSALFRSITLLEVLPPPKFHCYYIFREPFSVSHLALTMAHLWSLARGPVVAAVFVPSPKHAASLRDKQVKI